MKYSDTHWMNEALKLGLKGLGRTRPNPPVGAVVVKSGELVSSGWHTAAGRPHAEATALRKAGLRAKGATLYVTLEPCSTFGKTPPCTEAILKSGIRRVVIASEDPNPVNSRKGVAILRSQGVRVETGCQLESGRRLIAPYSNWINKGLPYITLKLAMSLDGRIADHRFRSKWITGSESRKVVKKMRKRVDALMVGSRTVIKDNPGLTDGAKETGRLFRVIIDSSGSVRASARVFRKDSPEATIIATTKRCSDKSVAVYRKAGAQVWRLPSCRNQVSLKSLLVNLGKEGLHHVMCEGGGELAACLINQNLVNECVFFYAPIIIGGHKSVPGIGGQERLLEHAHKMSLAGSGIIGRDLYVMIKPESGKRGAFSSLSCLMPDCDFWHTTRNDRK